MISRRNRPYVRTLTPSGGDDSAAFQAALTAVAADGGGEIVIDGMLQIGTGCTYAGNGLILRGTSRIKSGLKATAAGITTLTIGDNTTSFQGRHRISDLRFYASITKTAGAALSINAGGSECHVTHCQFLDHYDGITITGGAQNVRIRSNDFYGFTRDAVSINYSTSAEQATMGYGTTAWIEGNSFCGAGFVLTAAAGSSGVRVMSGDSIFIKDNFFVSFEKNINIAPVRNHSPETGFYVISGNVSSDSVGYNLYVDGSTYQVSKIAFDANHFLYTQMGTAGACVTGAYANALRFNNCFFSQNVSGAGLVIGTGAQNIGIFNCVFNGNYQYGLDIASAVTGLHISDNLFTAGNLGAGTASVQYYGIRYGGSHSNCIVTNNNMVGNLTAATTGTAPATNSTVTGNIS